MLIAGDPRLFKDSHLINTNNCRALISSSILASLHYDRYRYHTNFCLTYELQPPPPQLPPPTNTVHSDETHGVQPLLARLEHATHTPMFNPFLLGPKIAGGI